MSQKTSNTTQVSPGVHLGPEDSMEQAQVTDAVDIPQTTPNTASAPQFSWFHIQSLLGFKNRNSDHISDIPIQTLLNQIWV